MNNSEPSNINTYCYEEVLSEIAKGTIENSVGKSKFYTGNSPNNVKRLIISPKGVYVQYNLAVQGRLLHFKQFKNIKNVQECFRSTNYKPMVSALVGSGRGKYGHVCSCIEEIVYLTKSDIDVLPSKELDLSSLLRDSTSISTKDIKSAIADRFPRLHAIIQIPMTLREFHSSYIDKLKKNTSHLADLEELQGNIVIFNTEWWKQKPLRKNFYSLDSELKLGKYFSKIEDKITANKKEQDINDLKKDLYGNKLKDINSLDKELQIRIKGIVYLNSLLTEVSAPNLSEGTLDELNRKIMNYMSSVLINKQAIDKNLFSELTLQFINIYRALIDNKEISENDLYTSTIETLKTTVPTIQFIVSSVAVNSVNKLSETYPVLTKFRLLNLDTTLLSIGDSESKELKIVKSGISLTDSFINSIAILASILLIDETSSNKVNKSSKISKDTIVKILGVRG